MEGWKGNSSLPRYPFPIPMVSLNAMAAASSLVNPFTPVTPPPESQTFRKPMVPPSPGLKRKATEAQLCGELGKENERGVKKQNGGSTPQVTPKSEILPPQPSQVPPFMIPGLHGQSETVGPDYVAMASRIAAHYQQRCQAVANYQNQRCQAWANMQRQKCQDMMQAAMLVVAWYIRDRIQRRRRKQKRRFKAGLRTQQGRATRSQVTRGETVRRWVMQVPEAAVSPHLPLADKLLDEDEAAFSMDNEPTPDKDAKLFQMADGLIKSQYSKIEVPLMGVVSFDDSDSDSNDSGEEDADIEYNDDELDGDNAGVDGKDDEDYCDDDDLLDDDYLEDDDLEDEDQGSEIVHHGTGTGSGRNGRSSSLS
jgi:hypothetical protein